MSNSINLTPFDGIIPVFGLGVFSMARRHALVSLRHAAPSQRHAALFYFFFFFFFFFFFLGLLLISIIMWWKRDDKLTTFMTYGGSYTSVLLRLPCWISLFNAQVQASCYKLCPVLFIGPGLLIRQPLFYDFTVAHPWLFAQSLKPLSRTANMASSFTPSQQCSSLTEG